MRLRRETAVCDRTLPPDGYIDWKRATGKKYGTFLHDAIRCCASWPHIKLIYNRSTPEMPEGNTSHSRIPGLFFFFFSFSPALNNGTDIFLKTTSEWVVGEKDQRSMSHRMHQEKVSV